MRSILLSLLIMCGCASASLKDTAHGIFSLTKSDDPNLSTDTSWKNANVTGVTIRTWWKRVQPNKPTGNPSTDYNWSYIDKAVRLAQNHNKKIGITLTAGLRSPDWVYAAGAKKFTIQNAGVMPCPWDTTFLSYWQTFIKEFGNRYDSKGVLAYVTAEGPGRTEECYFCKGQADINELISIAGSEQAGIQLWINAAETIAGYYATWFPTTPFIYENGTPVPGDNTDYGVVVDSCVSAYGVQFGIKSDGLYPHYLLNSWGGQKILALSKTGNQVGFQDLRVFSNPNDLQTSLNKGISLGAHYVEVYTADVTASNDQAVLQAAQAQLLGAK
jgi:hypothetical protein